MNFGAIPLSQAAGAILAHAVSAGSRRLRKGHALSVADLVALQAAGVTEVIAARLEEGDAGENEAAARIAAGLRTRNVERRPAATGRVNLHAALAGILTVDRALIDAINAVDPAITLATLPALASVAAGQMVATVKIIPFAVSGASLAATEALCAAEAFAVEPFQAKRVALIQTTLPGLKPTVLDKTSRVTQARLARSASTIVRELRVPHSLEAATAALAEALPGADMAILFGASAVCDSDDVIPAAIRAAGGEVLRVGMPVDPGNLLVLGAVGGRPVLGAPGCARSPKENGFDWVLDRLSAGVPLAARDIAGLGVGGLLAEIPSRPQPRNPPERVAAPRVHAVILAAGRSSRMDGPNKLLARFAGEPLIRLVALRALKSKARSVLVVTGHQPDRIAETLDGLPLALVHNPQHAIGLASSLRAGIAALPPQADGALVILGDMPGIGTADLDRMIETFESGGGRITVRATANGKRGNPVILPRALFPAVAALEGDTGARQIVESGPVIDVELGEAAGLDVDTPEAMAHAGGILQA